MPFTPTVGGSKDYHTKWSKSERERQIWYNIHVQSKIWHKQTYLPNRNRLIDTEIRLVVAKGEEGRRRGMMDWDFEVDICKLLLLEWMNSKVLLYSTGNYIQSPGMNHNGKEYFTKNVYMCKTASLCCTAGIGTTL